jgi:hypothetical protein
MPRGDGCDEIPPRLSGRNWRIFAMAIAGAKLAYPALTASNLRPLFRIKKYRLAQLNQQFAGIFAPTY